MGRLIFYLVSLAALAFTFWAGRIWSQAYLGLMVIAPLIVLGVHDIFQPKHAILRNFPVVGHFRYILEALRPEMHQYFIESDVNGLPFSREMRSVVYQRAKGVLDTIPFGTRHDVYETGYEWIDHALTAKHPPAEEPRVTVGAATCKQPYEASLLNISAMSFGSLSKAAILALNGGARDGGFAHNTGEGAISPYHLEPGGDLVWQIGTAYFGCRTPDGRLDRPRFRDQASLPQVKMIELKLSQGAKPGHGGILPAVKITREIARIRGVPLGKDVLSPPYHTAFDTPEGLMELLAELRELSGGKPVGIKLCVGRPRDVFALCKAMHKTGLHPDFITIDGGEGGTGAAPLEFSNSMGRPLFEGLVLVHSALRGTGLRDKVRLAASGRTLTGFHMATRMALGADICMSARAFLFSLGCIQALRCNANTCPTGIATQDAQLMRGLVVEDKRARVTNYHRETVASLLELTAAAGLDHPHEITPDLIHRRISANEHRSFAELYPLVEEGAFLNGGGPEAHLERAWQEARAEVF